MHLLVCDAITIDCEELRENRSWRYDDFFGDISSQVAVTKLFGPLHLSYLECCGCRCFIYYILRSLWMVLTQTGVESH